MFQNFDAPKAPVRGRNRLDAVRALMHETKLDALLVPHADEQRNEYLPANAERLAWLSGFTGSAGEAIVTIDQAILFVDGRYTLQAADQVDPDLWQVESLIDNPAHKWLAAHPSDITTIGYNPWLHTANEVGRLQSAADKTGAVLRALDGDLIDNAWNDQPAQPRQPVRIQPFEQAGKLTTQKLEDMDAALLSADAELCVVTDPSSICWLFNIRGSDVAHTPITLAHAILRRGELPLLFIASEKLDIETKAFLNQVSYLHEPGELPTKLTELAQNAPVMLDPDLAAYAFTRLVEEAGGTVIKAADPARLPRAIKNDVEIEGARTAHLRDAAAITSYLAWLDEQKIGSLDEITAAKKLESFRSEMAGNMPLRDIAFDTISGSGPNGAIVHYRVTQNSNRTLEEGELYLSDSGGQYQDGTTDITRTIAIGTPSREQRRAFTLVLRGHIAIALARFPKGTRGMDLDPLARMPLWQHGMDYAHGTGHGVGSYLSVHEGPQSISRRGAQELLPGMILSNEPGYYRAGEFGIRIENLVLVREASDIQDGDIAMMGFETLTLAPIDQRLIDPALMSDDELHWLNAYHGWVRRKLEPLVSDETNDWLRRATEPMLKDLPPASA